ncbi:MAG: PAS domain S-box protein [Zoogloeaceae bacterium]|nr:PAS domain S-box protein [Zoogloeaceae bacterium]MCK6385894.1 PAS domain S-box protein [Rhodocyclaceae bacterium]
MTTAPPPAASARRPVAAFLLLAAAVAALWFFAFEAFRQSEIAAHRRELAAIGEAKVQRIQLWLDDLRGDAAVLAGLTFVRDALAAAPDAARLADGRRQLELVRAGHRCEAVLLFDAAARLRLAAGEIDDDKIAAVVADNGAFAAGGPLRIASLRLRKENAATRLLLQIVAPVVNGRARAGSVVLLVDALAAIDPLAAVNRGRIKSREVGIFERHGAVLRALNTPLYARPGELSIEAAHPLRPAALAARGTAGPLDGRDYRDVAVMAHADSVPGIDWLVVAKQDRAEVAAPLNRTGLWSGALSALLLLAAGIGLAEWRRHREKALALARADAAQQALRSSEARLRKLNEQATDIGLLFDRDMRVRYATPSAAIYVGHPAEGEPIATGAARVHPDDVAAVEAARKAALERPGVPQRVRHRLLHDRDGWRLMEAAFTSLFDDPEVDGLSYQAHDVTERVAAELALAQSEARLRAVFDSAPVGIAIADAEGRFLMVNREQCRMLGYGEAELIGRRFAEFTHREDIEANLDLVALVRSGDSDAVSLEKRYERKDGRLVWVLLSVARIQGADGTHLGTVGVAQDITERREAEAQRLDYARRQRDTLVREVHHRIKNHLQGLAGLLRRQIADRQGPEAMLEETIAQINAISIVHGLQGRTVHGQVSLRGLLREILAFLGSLHRLPLKLEARDEQCFGRPCPDDEACVFVVPDEEAVPVALVVNELLTNAVRHRTGTAAPAIELECDEAGARLTVRNAGRLPPQGLDVAQGKGLGTGLALVRSLMSPQGMAIGHLETADGLVETRLTLAAPAIRRAPAAQLASLR